MNITIKSVTLLLTDGADILLLNSNLPNGAHPFDGCAQLQITVAKDQGANYIVKHFASVPAATIDTRE